MDTAAARAMPTMARSGSRVRVARASQERRATGAPALRTALASRRARKMTALTAMSTASGAVLTREAAASPSASPNSAHQRSRQCGSASPTVAARTAA